MELRGGWRRNAGPAGWSRASAIVLIVVAAAGQPACAGENVSRLVPWRVERDTLRFRAVATGPVMELLAVRPGMTILDIGAGTGQFAFEFARRLDGTGKVYATDTNEYCVDYMIREAERRGLGNLYPVLVRRDGLDEFYRKHRYDLITLFHLSMEYESQVDYFREMRGLMTEGGRLVLILYRVPTPFSPGDFTGDFRGLAMELAREPAGSPYYRVLKDSTRNRIPSDPKAELPAEVRDAIIGDLNDTLSDTRFPAYFTAGSVFRQQLRFLPGEQDFADWLLVPFRNAYFPKREFRPRDAAEARMYATVNKMLLLQRYREYLRGDGLFESGFTPRIRAAFGAAGYPPPREYPGVVPFEDLVVFPAR